MTILLHYKDLLEYSLFDKRTDCSGYVYLQSLPICHTFEEGFREAFKFLYEGTRFSKIIQKHFS